MKIQKLALLIFMIFQSSLSPFAQKKIVKLWFGQIPGAIVSPSYKCDTIYVEGNSPRICKVTDPTLAIFPAPEDKSNGTAIIIFPGGGYERLAIDHEGYKIAEWLNKLGITAFVLNYRLPSDIIMQDKSIGPLQDTQEAIRFVRRNSFEWNINPNKIGIIGFSAGGHLAATVSTHYNDKVYEPEDTISARPDFLILVYPVISMDTAITHLGSRENLIGKAPSVELIKKFSNELWVNANTPPAFLVHSANDGSVPVQNSINYFMALKKYNIQAELHIYEKGGHGYGLGKTNGTELTWPEACKNWLKAKGFL